MLQQPNQQFTRWGDEIIPFCLGDLPQEPTKEEFLALQREARLRKNGQKNIFELPHQEKNLESADLIKELELDGPILSDLPF